MKALGATSVLGLTGYASAAEGQYAQQRQQQQSKSPDNSQMFHRVPTVNIPVINGYHDCNVVWFIHTSASSEKMAERLTEMINYPTLHVPGLDDVADIDELADIYVFKNGIDQSDAEPWGGGPFGYQLDILDSVPGDKEYTSIRHANVVTWKESADPEIIKSVDELMEAKKAGRLTIKQTGVVVSAPVVSWPGDPYEDSLHMGMGSGGMTGNMQEMKGMMKEMCDQQQGSRNISTSTSTDHQISHGDVK